MASQRISIQEFRAKLLSLAREDDPYPFLSFAGDYLAAVPDDDQVRALNVSLLLRKGLVTVAMEQADACPPHSPKAGELRTAVRELENVPSDAIDWRMTADVFDANLRALSESGDEKGALADQLRPEQASLIADFTLHEANDGNRLVRGTRSDGQRIWIPAALDFANRIETLGDTSTWRNMILPPFLLDGTGMGYLVPRLHAATEHIYLDYSPAIYVVEPNARGLALALHLNDWTDALCDKRVFLFAGPQAWSQWQQLMHDDSALPVPQTITTLTRWPGMPESPAQDTLQAVTQNRAALRDHYDHSARQTYAGRDMAFWADRYASSDRDPIRVMAVTSRFTTFLQHSTRDLLAAFERAGMPTKLLIERDDHTALPPHAYLEGIVSFQPDLIFVIDHHRHEYKQRFIDNVPFVCWIQDDLSTLFNPQTGPQLKEFDFTIGYGMTPCVLRHGYPAERFMPCKLAIEPAKFAPTGEDESRFRCDIVYVSHHAETPEQLHQRVRGMEMAEPLRKLVDIYFEQTRELFNSERFNGAYDLDPLIESAENVCGIRITEATTRNELTSLYFRPLADRTLRHATLRWAADYADGAGRTLHVYGRGWESHPRFGRYARGVAEHGGELAAISRQAAINLHTGMNSAMHQRVLETLCSGGFLLVRYHPFDFYEPGHRSFDRFVEQRGIDRPTEIPITELPEDYVELRRRRAKITGRPMPDRMRVTEEMILEARARSVDPERYHYANIAFPGFEKTVFDSAAAFAERAEHFLIHDGRRAELVHAMQETVRELFTYDALVPRILDFLRHRLNEMAGR